MSPRLSKPAVMDVQRPTASPADMVAPQQPTIQPPIQPAVAPALPQDQMPDQQPVSQNSQKKGKGMMITIILIVIVVLALIGGAVFYYLRANSGNNVTPVAETPAEQAPIVDDGYTDPADIDATVQKIDSSLTNLNDSADFGADDLNDSTIGL